jgi:hypothetical protein
MPATTINRLQTPLRQEFLKKLSANFRPLGKVGQVTHGQRAFRKAALTSSGIILTEVNVKSIANFTAEISQDGTSFASTGGTPASGTATGGYSTWDEIDYASAGEKTITASGTDQIGTRVVTLP